MGKLWMGLEGLGRFDDTPEHLPGNWREKVLMEEPNGDGKFPALLSKVKNEETDNYQFNWFEKGMPEMGGAVTAVYTNTALTSAYAQAQGAGTVVYVKCAADVAGLFVPGAAALLRCGLDFTADVVGKVLDVVRNGAKSYLAVRLIRADGNSSQNKTLANCDYVMRVGSIHPEGGKSPKSISRESERKYNLTQTFRNSLDITGRMLNTTFRTGNKYQERKGDVLRDHMTDVAWAFYFGEMYDGYDEDGQHETATKGCRAIIRDYAPDNIVDFTTLTGTWAKGKTWMQAGDQFIKNMIMATTQSGPTDRLVIGGNGVLAGLNALAENKGMWNYTNETVAYGIKVRRYETPFGVFDFWRDALFNRVPSLSNAAFVLYPGDLVYRFHKGRDTHFKKDPKNPFNNGKSELSGQVDIDGIHEEFLTDAGLELHFPARHAFISGVGLDNTQS